jgi:hypothetical protein
VPAFASQKSEHCRILKKVEESYDWSLGEAEYATVAEWQRLAIVNQAGLLLD